MVAARALCIASVVFKVGLLGTILRRFVWNNSLAADNAGKTATLVGSETEGLADRDLLTAVYAVGTQGRVAHFRDAS
jgi:hypothetical protein